MGHACRVRASSSLESLRGRTKLCDADARHVCTAHLHCTDAEQVFKLNKLGIIAELAREAHAQTLASRPSLATSSCDGHARLASVAQAVTSTVRHMIKLYLCYARARQTCRAHCHAGLARRTCKVWLWHVGAQALNTACLPSAFAGRAPTTGLLTTCTRTLTLTRAHCMFAGHTCKNPVSYTHLTLPTTD